MELELANALSQDEKRQLLSSMMVACVRWLHNVQNPDSGLPSEHEGSRSCTWTTSGLLWAAWCAGTSLAEPNLRRALGWVSSNINNDGGIPIVVKGDHSITDATAQTAIACSLLLIDVSCDKTVQTLRSCLRWLLDKRLTKSGWNWRQSPEPSRARTASTVFALVAVRLASINFPDLADEIAMAENQAVNWLRETQHRTGGWGSYAGGPLQPAITGLVCGLLHPWKDLFDFDAAIRFIRETRIESNGWPDTIDRPTNHTVTRIGNAYCSLALLEHSALESWESNLLLTYVLSAFEYPRFRYGSSEMFSWPTRDYLITLTAMGRHCGIDTCRPAMPSIPPLATPHSSDKCGDDVTASPIAPALLKHMTTKRYLHILHISDIHRAVDAPTSNVSLLGKLLDDITLRYSMDNRALDLADPPLSSPDLIVISGDVTQRATPEEFSIARDFVERLLFLVNKDRNKVILVPGNHDINWDLAARAYSPSSEGEFVNQRKQDEPYTQLVKRAPSGSYWRKDPNVYELRLDPFKQFYESFYGDRTFPLIRSEMYSIHDLSRELNIVVIGFNSCDEIDACRESGKLVSLDRRAFINTDAIYRAAQEAQQIDGFHHTIRIAVFHHNITSLNHGDDFLDPKYLRILKLQGFSFCVHGHAHTDSYDIFDATTSRVMPVVGAGSLAAPYRDRPPAVPMGYNLIAIDKSNGKVYVHTRSHDESNLTWAPRYQESGKPFFKLDMNAV